MVSTKNFALNPNIIEMCLNETYIRSVNTSELIAMQDGELTKEEVVHGINDYLFYKIEIWQT